jgi:hypothetical protein
LNMRRPAICVDTGVLKSVGRPALRKTDDNSGNINHRLKSDDRL